MRRSPCRLYFLLLSGLFLASGTLPVVAQPAAPPRHVPADPYADHIVEASHRFGIPAAWIRAVMRTESAGDPRAVSCAGAIGLMQIMPTTWASLRARHRLGPDPFDPRDNILAGTAYLRELHDRYRDPVAMLAAYNAGPGRYEASLAGRPLPAETRAYLATLAPIVGGPPDVRPIQVAALDPHVWTRSPLFIARAERRPAALSASDVRASADPTDAADRNGPHAAEVQPDRLFVARSGSGITP